ncbi:MAG: cobyric acid synthase [Acidimicrobiales bacterium]
MIGPGLRGALMVCGTTSDAGKTTVVTGLCRLLARRGVSVAPFKAQNMALNSAVTPAGHEIGRAQAAQAQAAGIEPDVAMNPILLKPTSDRTSQVVLGGRPWASLDAAEYHRRKPELQEVVLSSLAELRARHDVVLCEGAGSPAEINLLDHDLVNLGLARRAGLAALVVGDIERGGVFAALYGTVALLPDELRACVGGFVINKFRGDPGLLGGGPAELQRRCGVPTLGVLPWVPTRAIDAEDSLALRDLITVGARARSDGVLDVAVIRFPRISNFTDLEPLAVEREVSVRLVEHPGELGRPDLLVLPGSKATVSDLAWLRGTGLAAAVVALAAESGSPSTTIVGICAGQQMLGRLIDDPIESRSATVVNGLGLLPTETLFGAEKVTRLRHGQACGMAVQGYEIRHGRTEAVLPWITLEGGEPEGNVSFGGRVLGTGLHGLWEADGFRSAFLASVAGRVGKRWAPSTASFAAAREERFDRLADLMEAHLDLAAIERLVAQSTRPAVSKRSPHA